jgi:hypothetical protein
LQTHHAPGVGQRWDAPLLSTILNFLQVQKHAITALYIMGATKHLKCGSGCKTEF